MATIACLVFAAAADAQADSTGFMAPDGSPLPNPLAILEQEHDKFVALYPGFKDETGGDYFPREVRIVLNDGMRSADQNARVRLRRAKTGSYSVKLWQTNARVNVLAVELQDPSDPYRQTFIEESVSFDDDMFSNKTVRLTPMLLRRAPGRYKMVQWGRSVRLKQWDDFRPANLVKTFMSDKEIVEPLHVSTASVRPKKLTAKQRAEGDLYIAINQGCISRYSGNLTCKKLLTTAYRATPNRGKAITYGRDGYALGSVINVITDSRNGRITYPKVLPVHSFYFEGSPR